MLTDALQFLEAEVGGSGAPGGEGGGGSSVGLGAASSSLSLSAGGAGGTTLVPRFSPADLKLAAAHQGVPYGTPPAGTTTRSNIGATSSGGGASRVQSNPAPPHQSTGFRARLFVWFVVQCGPPEG